MKFCGIMGAGPHVDLAQPLNFCTGAERIRGEHYLTTTGAAAQSRFLNENDYHYENETHFGFFSKSKKTPLGDGAKKPILRSPIKSPVF